MEFRYDKGGDLTPSRQEAYASSLAVEQRQNHASLYAYSRSIPLSLVLSINQAHKSIQKAVLTTGKNRRVILRVLQRCCLFIARLISIAWGGAECLSFNFVAKLFLTQSGH